MDRFSLRFLVSVLMGVAGLCSTACGDIIYTMEDHPAFQNGHSLSGTITTTDTAPDDGLLLSSEIVDWAFSVSGPNAFTAAKSTGSPAPVVTGAVGISPTAITMQFPVIDPSVNELTFSQMAGGPTIRYLQVLDFTGPGVFGEYSGIATAGSDAWQSLPDETGLGNPWLIATAVPEPGPVALWCVATLVIFLRLRVQRKRQG